MKYFEHCTLRFETDEKLTGGRYLKNSALGVSLS